MNNSIYENKFIMEAAMMKFGTIEAINAKYLEYCSQNSRALPVLLWVIAHSHDCIKDWSERNKYYSLLKQGLVLMEEQQEKKVDGSASP